MKARRLKQIADWINEHLMWAGFRAEIRKGFCDTDTHIAGTRFRWAGKGRTGNRLLVFRSSNDKNPRFEYLNPDVFHGYGRKDEFVVLDHNAAETYRCNDEVEDWLARQVAELRKEK